MMQAGAGVVAGKDFELLRNPTNVGALPPHPQSIFAKVKDTSFASGLSFSV
jgi:hypothetical protein